MDEKVDIIEDKNTGNQYGVVYKNNRWEIDFFMTWIYIPPRMYRYNVGKFYMGQDKNIHFEFSDECPAEIKESMTKYYGNGTKKMIFTNMLTGEVSDMLGE